MPTDSPGVHLFRLLELGLPDQLFTAYEEIKNWMASWISSIKRSSDVLFICCLEDQYGSRQCQIILKQNIVNISFKYIFYKKLEYYFNTILSEISFKIVNLMKRSSKEKEKMTVEPYLSGLSSRFTNRYGLKTVQDNGHYTESITIIRKHQRGNRFVVEYSTSEFVKNRR